MLPSQLDPNRKVPPLTPLQPPLHPPLTTLHPPKSLLHSPLTSYPLFLLFPLSLLTFSSFCIHLRSFVLLFPPFPYLLTLFSLLFSPLVTPSLVTRGLGLRGGGVHGRIIVVLSSVVTPPKVHGPLNAPSAPPCPPLICFHLPLLSLPSLPPDVPSSSIPSCPSLPRFTTPPQSLSLPLTPPGSPVTSPPREGHPRTLSSSPSQVYKQNIATIIPPPSSLPPLLGSIYTTSSRNACAQCLCSRRKRSRKRSA